MVFSSTLHARLKTLPACGEARLMLPSHTPTSYATFVGSTRQSPQIAVIPTGEVCYVVVRFACYRNVEDVMNT